MNWREAFIEQARSDNRIRKLLNKEGVEYAHQLHYVQMTTEKLARGFLANPQNQPGNTHVGFVRYLQVLKGRPEIRRQLGYKDSAVFTSYVNSLLPLARDVERLAPALAGRTSPNPEYPWQDSHSGDVLVPATFHFPMFSQRDMQMTKLMKLLDSLLEIAI
jgi:hypothetical protein